MQAAGSLCLLPHAVVNKSGCSLIPCVFNNFYQQPIVASVDYATSIIHLCSLTIYESFLSRIQYIGLCPMNYAGAGLFVVFSITFRLCVTLRRPVMT